MCRGGGVLGFMVWYGNAQAVKEADLSRGWEGEDGVDLGVELLRAQPQLEHDAHREQLLRPRRGLRAQRTHVSATSTQSPAALNKSSL